MHSSDFSKEDEVKGGDCIVGPLQVGCLPEDLFEDYAQGREASILLSRCCNYLCVVVLTLYTASTLRPACQWCSSSSASLEDSLVTPSTKIITLQQQIIQKCIYSCQSGAR